MVCSAVSADATAETVRNSPSLKLLLTSKNGKQIECTNLLIGFREFRVCIMFVLYLSSLY